MSKIIDFNAYNRRARNKKRVMNKDQKQIPYEIRAIVLRNGINETLQKYNEWVLQSDTEEIELERLEHLFCLINCKSFLHEDYEDSLMNTYLKRVTKWELFKLLIGK